MYAEQVNEKKKKDILQKILNEVSLNLTFTDDLDPILT